MIVAAAVLIVVASAAVVLVWTGSVGGMRIDVANFQLTTSSAQMFLAGAVTAIALAGGILLLRAGIRRDRRRRRIRREADQGVATGGDGTPDVNDPSSHAR